MFISSPFLLLHVRNILHHSFLSQTGNKNERHIPAVYGNNEKSDISEPPAGVRYAGFITEELNDSETDHEIMVHHNCANLSVEKKT
jgi:hypothetical protein